MFTIGHSTISIDAFLRVLNDNGVQILADIRTVPKSRHNPQFAQEALALALQAAGVEYCWAANLGGLRRPHKDSINAAWRNASFRGYADYMQTPEFAAAVDGLLATAERGPTAIMCAEAVPWRCHRSLVADALLARGVPVEDIFHDSNGASHRKSHNLTPFARVEGTRVWYPADPDQPLLPGLSG